MGNDRTKRPASDLKRNQDTKHRSSPLVQGGLEIPIKVVIEMEATTRNREIINKYKPACRDELQPVKEPDRNGLFEDWTKDILQQLTRTAARRGNIDSDEKSSHAET